MGHQSGVAGHRALRVDHDDVARLQVGCRGVEGAARVGRAAGDRDLPGVPEDLPGQAPEHRLLGEEVRDPPVVVHQTRAGQRVEHRDVVGHEQHRAGARQPVAVAVAQPDSSEASGG
jgi:hypothetical protein